MSKKTKKLKQELKKLNEDYTSLSNEADELGAEGGLLEKDLHKTKAVVETLQAVKRLDGDIIKDQLQRIEEVYRERAQVVAALSKIFPAHLKRDPTMLEEEYQTVVCVHLPAGQAGWHISDKERQFFTHLEDYDLSHQIEYDTCEYDGHSAYIKYERLNALPVYGQLTIKQMEVHSVKEGHYFSKVNEVEAVPWTGRNVASVKKFAGDKVKVETGSGLMLLAGKDGAQEWVPVPKNHWLVCSVGDKSDIWPVQADYFANKYEP